MTTRDDREIPCPHCGRVNDAATGFVVDVTPAAGDFSICWKCISISIFTGDGLKTRRALPDELLAALSYGAVLQALQLAITARVRRLQAEGKLQ